MEHLNQSDANSHDIVADNIDKLKAIFPEAFTEGKIDFDVLKETLGEYRETCEERYNFSWAGKSKARRLAQTPTTGTLRPCPEESVDWDKTENLFIEGDNLEVLKLLQKSYQGQVKMIYIDPPYNTGGDFVYPDKYADNLKGYLEYTNQVDAEGNKQSSNTEASGRYHSNWLNMMMPRIQLASNLLARDGAIFLSIGQDEINNLYSLCNDILGEDNFVSICSRVMKTGGQKGTYFSPCVDYILVYAKSIDNLNPFRTEISQNVIDKVYTKIANEGDRKGEKYRSMGLYQAGLDKRANQRYYIECPDGTLAIPPGNTFPHEHDEGQQVEPDDGDGVWRWTYSRYSDEKKRGNIEFIRSDKTSLIRPDGTKSDWNIYYKIWLKDRLNDGQLPGNILTKFENRHSSAELKDLGIPFDFAKPINLIKFTASLIGLNSNDICLDFFAGSASTAHAVMDYSAQRNSNSRYICVQLPEKTHLDSAEYKAGFSTIADIGKERIRRAAAKIKEDHPDYDGDLGFKVFKLDSSNIEAWDSNIENLKDNVLNAANVLKDDRNELDIVYELFLKYGLDLSYPVNTHEVAGKQVYEVGAGSLFICLEDGITTDFVEALIKLYESFDDEAAPRVVFKDSGFKTDAAKKDAESTLKDAGILDVKCL